MTSKALVPVSNLPEPFRPEVTLSELETVIDVAFAGNLAACRALQIIHDRKLYKQGYGSWERYCLERWQRSEDTANRMIAVSKAMLALPPGSKPPSQRAAKAQETAATQNPAHPPSPAATATSTDASKARGTLRSTAKAATTPVERSDPSGTTTATEPTEPSQEQPTAEPRDPGAPCPTCAKLDGDLLARIDKRAADVKKDRAAWLRAAVESALKSVEAPKTPRPTTAHESQTAKPEQPTNGNRRSVPLAQPGSLARREVQTFPKSGAK